MDFDLSDWTVDSHVLQLDKQLFGPKEQLTVSTLNKNGKKHKKQKSQETLIKTNDALHNGNNTTRMSSENGKLPKHKKLKKERLKQLKMEKPSVSAKNEKRNTEKVLQKDKEKILKRKYDAAKGDQSERGSQKKQTKHAKIKHSGDADNEESQSDKGSQKKRVKLQKRKHSDDADNQENKSEHSSQKKKRKLIAQDSVSKNNSMLKSGKKLKLDQDSRNFKERKTENDTNDSKIKEEMDSCKLLDKKKRKKKKKNSSKKNKYKHLDEERAKQRQSLGEDSVKKSLESFNVKIVENKNTDSPKSKPKTVVLNGSSGISEGKKKKKKKSLSVGLPEGQQGLKEREVVSNDHKVESEGKHTKNSKNSPFNLSKLHKILSPKDQVKKEKTSVEVKSGDNKADSQQSPEKKKSKPESLRDRMMEQLKSARFRYINEQLYTRSGSEAVELFKEDKESFSCYHEGFQNQVEKWPTNPVDVIIKQIKSGSKTAVIGDFGCGDAKIARSVPNNVHSFDLVALNEHVTVCNIEKVPLKNNSLDTAVFCLSLMGTNLAEYLEEANRVLKKGGTLMIAEVTSRIDKVGKFIRNIERMGFRVNNRDTSNDMFILLDFMKIGKPGDRLPEITLDPCVYKKR